MKYRVWALNENGTERTATEYSTYKEARKAFDRLRKEGRGPALVEVEEGGK